MSQRGCGKRQGLGWARIDGHLASVPEFVRPRFCSPRVGRVFVSEPGLVFLIWAGAPPLFAIPFPCVAESVVDEAAGIEHDLIA